MVPVRDGTRLATDVYLPPDPRPVPALLCRTPYDRADANGRQRMARGFAEAGYAAVIQSTRGRHGSEGEFAFLRPDAEDGHDTVAWLRGQPWCDGRIGTWGGSYEGWTQTAMAALGTHGIAAMVPYMSGANGFASSIRHGGTLELRWPAWAFANSGAPATPPFSHWLPRWPVRAGQTQLSQTPHYERMVLDLMRHDRYDEYWAHPSLDPLSRLDQFPDAPALIIGGWYDSYVRGSTELFAALARRDSRTRLVVGPWTHCRSDQPDAGDVRFGDAATIDLLPLHLRWFDAWLRDAGDDRAPVRLFVMGGGSGRRGPDGRILHGGHWRDETGWPPAHTRFTRLYLHHDGTLGPGPASATDAQSTFDFDPAHPVPTRGGSISALVDLVDATGDTHPIAPGGGYDQGPPGAHPDVLTFQTPPLKHPVEVTGPVAARLWTTSTAASADLAVKLVDVYPDGFALNITDSIVRRRVDHGIDAVTIELYPTSNLFAAGHRIRVDLAGSNFPRFDLNPAGFTTTTVWHDTARPSHLLLPTAGRTTTG